MSTRVRPWRGLNLLLDGYLESLECGQRNSFALVFRVNPEESLGTKRSIGFLIFRFLTTGNLVAVCGRGRYKDYRRA